MSSEKNQNFTEHPDTLDAVHEDNITESESNSDLPVIVYADLEVAWGNMLEAIWGNENARNAGTFSDSGVSYIVSLEDLPEPAQKFFGHVFQLLENKKHYLSDDPQIANLTQYVIANLDILDNLKNIFHGSARYYLLKASILSVVSLDEEALTACDQALNIDDTLISVSSIKIIALQHLGRHNEVLLEWDKLIASDPQNAENYLDKGRFLRDLQQNEEALIEYNKAIDVDPQNIAPYICKIDLLLELNKNLETIPLYNKMIEIDPSNLSTYYGKGQVLLTLKLYDEALLEYDNIIKCDANCLNAHLGKAGALMALEKSAEALEEFDKVISIDPSHAQAYHCKLKILFFMKSYEEVLALCDIILSSFKADDIKIHLKKAEALAILNRSEEALLEYDNIIQLQPDKPETYYKKANLLLYLSRHQDSLIECDRIIAHFPKNTKPYHMKALIFSILGRKEEELLEYKKAIAIDPNDTSLYYSLHDYFMELGQIEEADAWLKKASAIDEAIMAMEELQLQDENSNVEEDDKEETVAVEEADMDEIWGNLHNLRYVELEQYFGKAMTSKEDLGNFAIDILENQKKEHYPEALLVFLHLRHICNDYDTQCSQMHAKLNEYYSSADFALNKEAVWGILYRRYDGEMHRKKHSDITKDDWMRAYNEVCEDLEVSQFKLTEACIEDKIVIYTKDFCALQLQQNNFTKESWGILNKILNIGITLASDFPPNSDVWGLSTSAANTCLSSLISSISHFQKDFILESKLSGGLDDYMEELA